MASGPSSARARSQAMSSWPTCTPSAPTANAHSTSSFTTKGTPAARQSASSSSASARRSSALACLSLNCTKVVPPASASSTHSASVRSPSHALSVTAYSFKARRIASADHFPRSRAGMFTPCSKLKLDISQPFRSKTRKDDPRQIKLVLVFLKIFRLLAAPPKAINVNV